MIGHLLLLINSLSAQELSVEQSIAAGKATMVRWLSSSEFPQYLRQCERLAALPAQVKTSNENFVEFTWGDYNIHILRNGRVSSVTRLERAPTESRDPLLEIEPYSSIASRIVSTISLPGWRKLDTTVATSNQRVLRFHCPIVLNSNSTIRGPHPIELQIDRDTGHLEAVKVPGTNLNVDDSRTTPLFSEDVLMGTGLSLYGAIQPFSYSRVTGKFVYHAPISNRSWLVELSESHLRLIESKTGTILYQCVISNVERPWEMQQVLVDARTNQPIGWRRLDSGGNFGGSKTTREWKTGMNWYLPSDGSKAKVRITASKSLLPLFTRTGFLKNENGVIVRVQLNNSGTFIKFPGDERNFYVLNGVRIPIQTPKYKDFGKRKVPQH